LWKSMCFFCSVSIKVKKPAAVVAILGDADASLNPCTADGLGRRTRSCRAQSRGGVRGELWSRPRKRKPFGEL
jgi:hypothetical protein